MSRETLFRVQFGIVGRSTGGSALRRSAYQKCDALDDFDYSDKTTEHRGHFMLVPDTASWATDAGTVWRAAEAMERRCDAQLSRTIEVTIPRAIPDDQRADFVRSLIQPFIDDGFIAQFDLHDVAGTDGRSQPHAHVQMSLRRATATGFEKTKARDANADFVLDDGRVMRARFADRMNTWFRTHGIPVHVDHRSFADRGIDRPPAPELPKGLFKKWERQTAAALAAGQDPPPPPKRIAEYSALMADVRAAETEIEEAISEQRNLIGDRSTADADIDAPIGADTAPGSGINVQDQPRDGRPVGGPDGREDRPDPVGAIRSGGTVDRRNDPRTASADRRRTEANPGVAGVDGGRRRGPEEGQGHLDAVVRHVESVVIISEIRRADTGGHRLRNLVSEARSLATPIVTPEKKWTAAAVRDRIQFQRDLDRVDPHRLAILAAEARVLTTSTTGLAIAALEQEREAAEMAAGRFRDAAATVGPTDKTAAVRMMTITESEALTAARRAREDAEKRLDEHRRSPRPFWKRLLGDRVGRDLERRVETLREAEESARESYQMKVDGVDMAAVDIVQRARSERRSILEKAERQQARVNLIDHAIDRIQTGDPQVTRLAAVGRIDDAIQAAGRIRQQVIRTASATMNDELPRPVPR